MKSISRVVSDFYNKIHKNSKLAFIYTTIAAFLCHLVFFIDRWANEDDIHKIFSEVNMLGSGRWMPGTAVSSNLVLPVVLFVITIMCLGIISALIVNMFKVEKSIYVFIISLLLATFPTLALSFGYAFMIERYMLGMLLAVLAVYLTNKYKYGFLVGGVTLSIVLGYYQSYIAITISLILLMIIIQIISNENSKKITVSIIRFLAMGLIGVSLYFILVEIINNHYGVELLDYKGINKMGTLPPLDQIGEFLDRTYTSFTNFFFSKEFWSSLWYGRLAQLVIYFINIILLIVAIINQKIYKKPFNLVLLIIVVLLLPFGFNIVDFMAYESKASSLNIYQFVFIFILFILILNSLQYNDDNNKVKVNIIYLSEWIGCIAALLLIWNNFIISNIYYLKINEYYNSTVLLTNRIYSRIESMPGFNKNTKVLVGNKEGIYLGQEPYRIYDEIFFNDQGIWTHFIGYSARPTKNDRKFRELVGNVLGIYLNSVSPEEFDEIYNSKEYDKMKSWPDDDCIKYINDVLVVKLS